MAKVLYKSWSYAIIESATSCNAFRTWPSVRDALDDGYDGLFGLRYKVKAGPHFRGDMTAQQTTNAIAMTHVLDGLDPSLASVCEYVPNESVVWQGEAQLTELGLYVAGGSGPGHMRDTMARATHVWNLRAREVLLTGGLACLERVTELLEDNDYDGTRSAIVEFATFSVPVGRTGDRFVVWEVRSY